MNCPSLVTAWLHAAAIPVALLLALNACGGGSQGSAGDEERDTGARADEVVVVRSLTAGDRACYMAIEDERGELSEDEASFELCDRADLVGARVRLTRETTPIMASACQGDPECALRDTVELIVQVEPAP